MSRTKQEWVATVLVRLTPEDLGALEAVGRSGEPRAHTFRRLAHEAVVPADTLIRYRKAPLLPAWLEQGPLSVTAAEERGRAMLARGFEVELHQVATSPARSP